VAVKHAVQSPDGRIWTITVSRFRTLSPLALGQGLFSSRRWVGARSDDAAPVRAVWSADRRDAGLVADELAESLLKGYEWESPAGAEFVEKSEPPGQSDLDG
jgi:hypothetical protein